MTTPQMPSAEHAQFDAICAPVDDFETLPTVAVQTLTSQYEAEPVGDDEPAEDRGEESLDDLILAGLVAPY
ncbi:MAG TPA: hypothetical protein VFB39_11970 [Solirubrobacteraceae bacterium]|jgi:hypothetical protein|nr:hypothetical protein [Solirubrobacteraceae bacterium]